MDNKKIILENKLTELIKILGRSRLWLKTIQKIGGNSELIKDSGFQGSFGILQMASNHLLSIEISKIFESSNSSIVSIPAILKELRSNHHNISNTESLKEKLKEIDIILSDSDLSTSKQLSKRLFEILPTKRNSVVLKQILDIRNKLIAHADHNFVLQKELIAMGKAEEIDKLIRWGDIFSQALLLGYFPEKKNRKNPNYWSSLPLSNLDSLIKHLVGEEKYFYF